MDTREGNVAALANAVGYDSMAGREYVDGAPHIKHAQLRNLYGKLVVAVYDHASQYADPPSVLDLGAGEGSVTLPFLELGAKVTAVDISRSQLEGLGEKCAGHADNLEVICQDVHDAIDGLRSAGRQFDIVVANSFLHHIPDYLTFVRQVVRLLSPHGQFFSFQDPLRHDSLGRFVTLFNNVAYACWRIGKGDVIAGLRRRLRRAGGVFLEDSTEDNVEYHCVRNGVDHEAIRRLFEESGIECEIIRYFGTQSSLFQSLGSALGVETMFATRAKKAA